MMRGSVVAMGVLSTLLVSAAASPGEAQEPAAKARIGWLTIASHPMIEPFREGMRERGYVEGENLVIEYRYADGHADRLPQLAIDLARDRVDVVVASGSAATEAARERITSTPVVGISNVAGMGGSLARPSGNMTGIALMYDETAVKWLELLHDTFPAAVHVGVLTESSPNSRRQLATISAGAKILGKQIVALDVADAAALDDVFVGAREQGVEALIVVSSPLFAAHAARIVELATRARLPTVYEHRDFVEHGGLMSYGPNLRVVFRHAAGIVDRILKGTKVSDLPIEQPTKFELVVNLKAAAASGFTISPAIVARADEVIE